MIVYLFVAGIKILRLIPQSKQIVVATTGALAVMRSTELGEHEKEAQIQKTAIRMFASLFSILARVIILFLVPALFVVLCSWLGFYSLEEVIRAATNWYFIIGSTVIMIVPLFWMR